MRIAFTALLVFAGCTQESTATGPTGGGKDDVWGTDDRVERYEIQTQALRDAAQSSGGTFLMTDLVHDETRDVWSAKTPTKTLGEDQHLCEGERFANQPAVAYCSATLIADDIMVSAGHCFQWSRCEDFAVVFDYAYDAAPTDPMAIAKDMPAANVYRCAEMLATEYNVDYDAERGADYAVFRLDRKVTGRTPARVNWTAPLVNEQPAYVIGHPSRIPQKLASGKVLDGTMNPDFIMHDADVFGGNSGCGLFDAAGTLIGIHVHSSAQRYTSDPRGCNVVSVCGENATCMRKPHAYDVRALKLKLSPELQTRLGIPAMPSGSDAGVDGGT
jgi:V8-like Glu-specific endopeptidase